MNLPNPKTNTNLITLYVVIVALLTVNLLFADDTDAISRIKRDMDFLCSPELSGRDAPGRDADRVADWIARRFTSMGLQPMFNGDYKQTVPLSIAKIDTLGIVFGLNTVSTNKADYSKWGEDFFYLPRRIKDFRIEGDIYLCGYGLNIPEASRNDYDGIPKGAIAIVLADADMPREKVGQRMAAPFKAAAAERAGAKMLVVVHSSTIKSLREVDEIKSKFVEVDRYLIDLIKSSDDFPVVHVRNSILEADLLRQANPSGSYYSRASLSVTFSDVNAAQSSNVSAYIQGESSSVIVIGAHYDHLGRLNDSVYYPGADDNASGVAGLLELAGRVSGKDAGVFKKSVCFVAFTCEEDGLLGSQWFVDNMPFPRDSIFTMINLDMIGREGFSNMRDVERPEAVTQDGYLAAFYSAATPELGLKITEIRDEFGKALKIDVKPVNSFRHFGDASPFHSNQIPTMHVFSGFTRDYHQVSDTIDRINFIKLENTVTALEYLIDRLLDYNGKMEFNPATQVSGSSMPY